MQIKASQFLDRDGRRVLTDDGQPGVVVCWAWDRPPSRCKARLPQRSTPMALG